MKTKNSSPPYLAALDRAIAECSLVELARRIDVSYQLIQGWRVSGRKFATPAEYVLKIEAATGVSRHELRPDIYGHKQEEAV